MKKRFAQLPDEREKPCPHKMVAYSGRVPCTGLLRCLMCGETVERGGIDQVRFDDGLEYDMFDVDSESEYEREDY